VQLLVGASPVAIGFTIFIYLLGCVSALQAYLFLKPQPPFCGAAGVAMTTRWETIACINLFF